MGAGVAVAPQEIVVGATDNRMEFAVRYVVDYKSRRTTKDRRARGVKLGPQAP